MFLAMIYDWGYKMMEDHGHLPGTFLLTISGQNLRRWCGRLKFGIFLFIHGWWTWFLAIIVYELSALIPNPINLVEGLGRICCLAMPLGTVMFVCLCDRREASMVLRKIIKIWVDRALGRSKGVEKLGSLGSIGSPHPSVREEVAWLRKLRHSYNRSRKAKILWLLMVEVPLATSDYWGAGVPELIPATGTQPHPKQSIRKSLGFHGGFIRRNGGSSLQFRWPKQQAMEL